MSWRNFVQIERGYRFCEREAGDEQGEQEMFTRGSWEECSRIFYRSVI